MRQLLVVFLCVFCASLYASNPSSIPGNKLIVQAPEDNTVDEEEGDDPDDDEDVIIMDDDDDVNN